MIYKVLVFLPVFKLNLNEFSFDKLVKTQCKLMVDDNEDRLPLKYKRLQNEAPF